MNIFTKFQPHISKSDIITTTRYGTYEYTFVYCQPLYVGTYDVFFIFGIFLSRKQCFRVVFRALHDKVTHKHVLRRQIGYLDV